MYAYYMKKKKNIQYGYWVNDSLALHDSKVTQYCMWPAGNHNLALRKHSICTNNSVNIVLHANCWMKSFLVKYTQPIVFWHYNVWHECPMYNVTLRMHNARPWTLLLNWRGTATFLPGKRGTSMGLLICIGTLHRALLTVPCSPFWWSIGLRVKAASPKMRTLY